MAKKTKQSRRVVLEKPLKLKPCPFDKEDAPKIDYKNVQLLKKYLSDKSKIRSRRVTGLCTQHQSDIALAVKNAREIALLPFVSTGR